MSARQRIVLVHDVPEFVATAAAALQEAGYEVAQFADPQAAWEAVRPPAVILITRVRFAPGKPHGIALAARARSNGLKVIFTALLEYAADAKGLGLFMPMPVNIPDLVEAVRHLTGPAATGR
jgi:CheY-like chemotaxis protein